MNGGDGGIGDGEGASSAMGCWFHPRSESYFCSANLTKVSKRSKAIHKKTRIPLAKYEKKSKRFRAWHEKKFEEIKGGTVKPKGKYKVNALQSVDNGGGGGGGGGNGNNQRNQAQNGNHGGSVGAKANVVQRGQVAQSGGNHGGSVGAKANVVQRGQ